MRIGRYGLGELESSLAPDRLGDPTRVDEDLGDGIDTTAVLARGQPRSSAIELPYDTDAFRVSLIAGITYFFRVRSDEAGPGEALADPLIVGLLDASGRLIGGTDDDDSVGLEPRTVFTPATSGTYYLVVGAYGARTGDYTAVLNFAGTATPDVPEGDASVAFLPMDGTVPGSIGEPGDRDSFRVRLEQGATYAFELTGRGVTGLDDPVILGVAPLGGTTLPGSGNDDWGGNLDSRVQLVAPATGVYLITVGGFLDATGAYRLSAERLSGEPAQPDVGNTVATAVQLRAGQDTVGEVDTPYDTDWFRMYLVAGRSYRFDLRGEPSGGGTLADPEIVGMFDSAGELVPGTATSGGGQGSDAALVFTPTETGRYFLSVGGYFLGTGRYTVSFQAETEAARIADVPADVTTTSFARGIRSTGDIEAPGDVDWYRFDLAAGQRSYITLRGSDSGSGTLPDPLIRGVYDSSGNLLPGTGNDDSGGTLDSRVVFDAPETGSFYVAATAYGSATGTYTIQAIRTPPDRAAPRLVEADPADGAVQVAPGAELSLRFNEPVRAGEGFFRILGGPSPILLDATDPSLVRFQGNEVFLDPALDLAPNRDLFLRIDPGAIEDRSGNPHPGVFSPQRLNFRTGNAEVPTAEDEWTILVYVAADNNLEPFGLQDVNEMEAANLPGNVNLVVQVDRSPFHDGSDGNWSETRRGLIRRDNDPNAIGSALESIGERNMGAGASLTEFIDWAASRYAAQKTMLVVWDHGGGLSGVAWDDTDQGDNLGLAELREAIQASRIPHFDVVGFDTCLQGMVEQAFELGSVADVMVASEELEPGEGWQYTDWLNRLGRDPDMGAAQLGTAAVDSYVASLAGRADITMAATDLRQLGALESVLDRLVARVEGADGEDRARMGQALEALRNYPVSQPLDYRDLGEFALRVVRDVADGGLRDAAAAVAAQIDRMVLAQGGTVPGATGLSVYLPEAEQRADYTAANYQFLTRVAWGDLIDAI